MTFDQIAIVGLLLFMFVVYALDRFPAEHVAAAGLTAAFALGLVPVADVFSGFSSPAVMTVVEILLIVSVLSQTHAIEKLADRIVGRAGSQAAVLAVVCGCGAFVSVFMNNIGALALMFPVALSVCARLQMPAAKMLMPLSFATLLGGTCSLTGTPANLVVNQWKISETGGGFGYFTLGTVGLPITIAGLIWLVLAAPRLFRHVRHVPAVAERGPSVFFVEVRIPAGSALIGASLVDIERGHEAKIHDVLRSGAHVFARREKIELMAGDILIVECTLETLEGMQSQRLLDPTSGGDERIEAVVMPDSTILGSRIGALESFAERGLSVVALASRRRRIEGQFSDLQIGVGDVLVLAGDPAALREAAEEAELLPLSARPAKHVPADAYRSISIFILGVTATALGLAPPEIAFGGVVIVMALLGSLRLRPALRDVNWTIVILLACMIPLGAAVQETGAARVIANSLMAALPWADPFAVTTMMLVLAAALTVFVDNVSTAAVLSPVAAGISTRAGVPIEPLLVAVAIGTSLDFLSPFGHHNNAVVMGAAGYRFRDFPKLGFPLLLLCMAVALAILRFFWL
ncbi:MAG TPA: SLC13 family permease [Novosphingobium sp.]|nr:SLC13 family permease [Novosphingobium sp.]